MLKIAICDDDKYICILLESILDDISQKYCFNFEIDTFISGEALYEKIKENTLYDIIFLDIELKKLNGVETGNLIREKFSSAITNLVYISAKKEYAMQLFKLQPIDFIIKPIQYSDVLYILETVNQIVERNSREAFVYKVGNVVFKIPCKDIIYFESTNRKVNIISTQDDISFYSTLSDVHEKLDKLIFVSIHKSYIINYNHVKQIQYNQVIMSNNIMLPISQSKRSQVRSIIMINEGCD